MSEEQQIKSVGEWRIERLLGTGGASEVYEVEHSVYGIRRALKLFKPTAEVAKDPEKFRLLKERFGLIDGKEKTQKEVADCIGISQSYISRLEKKIIKKLRIKIESVS